MNKGAKDTNREAHKASLRRSGHDEYVAALRDGRKLRATTYADKGKVANKRACRGKVYA